MIYSKLSCLTSVSSCALHFHTIILCTHLGDLSLYHVSLMSLLFTLVIRTCGTFIDIINIDHGSCSFLPCI
jgi:hypothetical protein